MKYIITESQYKLLTEEKILELDFDVFNYDWNLLQRFLDKKGNPPYKLIGDLDLRNYDVKTLGSLVGVTGDLDLGYSEIKDLGNLKSVGGYLFLDNSQIESFGNLKSVGGFLDLTNTLLSKKTNEEIRNQVYVGGNIYFF